MSLWRHIMRLITPEPRSPTNVYPTDPSMDAAVQSAIERHKTVSEQVVHKALDQVSRTEDVSIALNTIVSRLKRDNDELRVAHDALQLIERERENKGSAAI